MQLYQAGSFSKSLWAQTLCGESETATAEWRTMCHLAFPQGHGCFERRESSPAGSLYTTVKVCTVWANWRCPSQADEVHSCHTTQSIWFLQELASFLTLTSSISSISSISRGFFILSPKAALTQECSRTSVCAWSRLFCCRVAELALKRRNKRKIHFIFIKKRQQDKCLLWSLRECNLTCPPLGDQFAGTFCNCVHPAAGRGHLWTLSGSLALWCDERGGGATARQARHISDNPDDVWRKKKKKKKSDVSVTFAADRAGFSLAHGGV